MDIDNCLSSPKNYVKISFIEHISNRINPIYTDFTQRLYDYLSKNNNLNINQVDEDHVEPAVLFILSYINSNIVKRFLIARKDNKDKAFEMWTKWIEWKIKTRPERITYDDVAIDICTNKAFIEGFDYNGRPLLILQFKKHFPNLTTLERTIKLSLYMFEKAISLTNERKEQEQVGVIADADNIGWSNFDKEALGKNGILTILQNYYPERLGQIYVVNVSMIGRLILKAALQFFDEKTKLKVLVLSKNDELYNYISKEELIEEYGGSKKRSN